MHYPEDLLQFLWKYKMYSPLNLFTVDEQLIEVIHPGMLNVDAGPDFFNAKIKIGNTLWAGNVEIHYKSSDWFAHKHHTNKAYNNVILHVVIDNDCEVICENGMKVPVLKIHVCDALMGKYRELMHQCKWLVCAGHQQQMSSIEQTGWLDALLIGRMQERCEKMMDLLQLFKGDWDQVFFVMLARALGFGVNSDAFEALARSISVKHLMHHADNLLQLEAMLFGQAGFLNANLDDSYQQKLAYEYQFLKEKFSLKPIESSRWKFLRLRPKNFPTVRIAQLAMFIHKYPQLAGNVAECGDIEQLRKCVDFSAGDAWLTRFEFGKQSSTCAKHLGETSQNLLLINAIIPFVFAYGLHHGNEPIQEKALEMLASLPPERNHILRDWEMCGGISAQNAAGSQALVFQYNNFCVVRKCLQCKVGLKYLQSDEIR